MWLGLVLGCHKPKTIMGRRDVNVAYIFVLQGRLIYVCSGVKGMWLSGVSVWQCNVVILLGNPLVLYYTYTCERCSFLR